VIFLNKNLLILNLQGVLSIYIMGANNAKTTVSEDPLSPEERDKLKATFQKVAGTASVAPSDKLQVCFTI